MKRFSSLIMVGTLLGAGAVGMATATAGATAASTKPPAGCAPGTFDDTDSVVTTIDATITKEMNPIQAAITNAKLAPGQTKTSTKTTTAGLLRKTTISRSADGLTYSFELDLAQPSLTPTFVVIGTATRTDAGTVAGVHTTNKHIVEDYDALRSFVPTSKATGNFDATIVDIKDPTKPAPGTQHTLTVSFSGITVKNNDKHGPRTGTYTHIGEAAIGGSLDYHGSIPVPCPSGPPTGPVEVTVQRKHVDDATTERSFRRDAVVTGGSLAVGAQAISFDCGTNPAKGSTVKMTRYGMHKTENADGSTKFFKVTLKNETAPACNPDFGALVSPTDNSTDWAFTSPVTFPGEW